MSKKMYPIRLNLDSVVHKFIIDWHKDENAFKVSDFYGVEFVKEIEIFEWKKYFPDYSSHLDKFKDKFYTIAVDGAGGNYVLWYYPQLQTNPPVILFDSEGGIKFIANSYQEFLYSFVNDEYRNFSSILDDYRDFLENKKNGYNPNIAYEVGEDVTEESVKEIWESINMCKKKIENTFTFFDDDSEDNKQILVTWIVKIEGKRLIDCVKKIDVTFKTNG